MFLEKCFIVLCSLSNHNFASAYFIRSKISHCIKLELAVPKVFQTVRLLVLLLYTEDFSSLTLNETVMVRILTVKPKF